MGKIYTSASMSLDGYISGPGEGGFDHLFKWYGSGEVEVPTADPEMTFRLSKESAGVVVPMVENTGALVVGRKLFDMVNGWGGRHPLGCPYVVLTHNPPEDWARESEHHVFVTEGIEAALDKAREIAGDKDIGVNGGVIACQCLQARALEEIWVALTPVLLGGGTPFFDQFGDAPVELEGPLHVVDAQDVTHLRYRVRYP